MVFIIAAALLLVFAGYGFYRNFVPHPAKEDPKTEQKKTKKENTAQVEEETADEKNYRTAKLKLEHPYSKVSDKDQQQVVVAFDRAMNDINKVKQLVNVRGTIENRLLMTDDAMVKTFAMAILANRYTYQKERLEVSPSDSEDVVQFLVVLTKENSENCYFVGNFNTTVGQIQLKAYVGGDIGGSFG